MTTSRKFAVTYYFKEILPDKNAFNQFVLDYTNFNHLDAINEYAYKHLYNMYCNSNVNYDTKEAFLRHFGITYENEIKRFKRRRELIAKQYELTDDELTIANMAITNMSAGDNTPVVNPLDKALEFISDQSATKQTINKLQAYLTALENMTTEYLDDFLQMFNKHFMQIYIGDCYNYD